MNGLGDAICDLFETGIILLLIMLPFAIWKWIDIGIWIWKHVSVVVK